MSLSRYIDLHKRTRYGISSELRGNPQRIQREIDLVQAKAVLDFGCGQSNVSNLVNVDIYDKYDPAIPEFAMLPPRGAKYDLVICTDVLEHILEANLNCLIETIQEFSPVGFYGIAFTPAGNFKDRTPFHVTLHPPEWWIEFLEDHYSKVQVVEYGGRGNKVAGFRCDYPSN